MDDSATRRSNRRKAGRTGCAVEATLSVIGGVWKPVLLFHLLNGKLRFNALCRLIPSATPRMITLQCANLKRTGSSRERCFRKFLQKWNMNSPSSASRSRRFS